MPAGPAPRGDPAEAAGVVVVSSPSLHSVQPVNEAAFEALVPRWLRNLSLAAALLTVPSVLLDVVIGLPQWLDVFARVLNWAVWSVFLVVLIVVLVRAPTRGRP